MQETNTSSHTHITLGITSEARIVREGRRPSCWEEAGVRGGPWTCLKSPANHQAQEGLESTTLGQEGKPQASTAPPPLPLLAGRHPTSRSLTQTSPSPSPCPGSAAPGETQLQPPPLAAHRRRGARFHCQPDHSTRVKRGCGAGGPPGRLWSGEWGGVSRGSV